MQWHKICPRHGWMLFTYCLYEMVMWDLREEMVDDMSPNVMVDVVDPSVVPVERRQATPKIGPFLDH